MQALTIEKFQQLVEDAKTRTSSGHPFLDERWRTCPEARRPYYRLCQQIAQFTKPKLIVELGIDQGDCCAHWASGNPTTQVLGVDVHKDSEAPSLQCRRAEATFSNFKYLRGWTWDKVDEVRAYGPIDILYIDSWHEYDYMAKDWNDYAPLLADNHIVLVDDLQFGQISHAFNEIPAKERYIDRTMNEPCPFGILLGVDKNYRFKHAKRDFMP
jgi:predicted O-methyltransferase YrrM